MMRYYYFPGCSMAATGKGYQQSIDAVARKIGLELAAIPDWNCCGATAAHTINERMALALPARNLARAEQDGGGMEIALSCDMVVAAENAKFGCTEVGLGIIASTGGIVRLARDINRKDCMELLLTGKKIKAPEAKALGLINYVVPAEEVLDRAIELAEECLKNAPLALKWTKYIVHAADQMSEEDAMRFSDAAYRFLEKTEDGIEGPAAFVEKRAPQWIGR